ncbi:peroxisomal membrane protein pex14 [Rhizophlyctis rosea]|nr:peroxisomal membrane protein pex14 [Rhizophlyctis rosea]
MSATTQVRTDVIDNAVRFLKDPKVQQSPLAKRVAFLESKGLSAEEIEQALAKVSGGGGGGDQVVTTSASVTTAPLGAVGAAPPPPPPPGYAPYPYPYPPPPPPPQTTWKDMVLVSAGVLGLGYAAYVGAKRYIAPLLSWPTETSVTEDTARIDRQITASSKALDAVHGDTKELMTAVDTHTAKVNTSLEELKAILSELKEAEGKGDEDLKAIKEDVEGLRAMIPKVLNTSKDAQTAVVTDLQNEIKSLKSLLINRRVPVPGSPTPASPGAISGADDTKESSIRGGPRPNSLPNFGKPTIPAWQLEQNEPKKPQPQVESSDAKKPEE